MSNRYKVTGSWSPAYNQPYAPFIIEEADIVDTRNGQVYTDGAMRVTVDGKPAKRGKGGTVPFFGECAWMDAERLASDLAIAERYVRTV